MYFDGNKTIGQATPDAFVRRWFKASNGVVVPFAVKLPADYDPETDYPMIVTSGGSYAMGNDCLGAAFAPSSSTLYKLGGSAPAHYLHTRKTDVIYLSVQLHLPAAISYPGPAHKDNWCTAVAELIAALDDGGDVDCYRYYGTDIDGAEQSLLARRIDNGDVLDAEPLSLAAGLGEDTISVDSNKIYYIGYSQGAIDAWEMAIFARDRLAGIMPIDVYFPIGSHGTDFYTNVLHAFGVRSSNSWCDALTDTFKNPVTGWDDAYTGTTKSAAHTNNREIATYAVGLFLRRIKHIPVVTYNGSGITPGQQGIVAIKAIYNHLKAAESNYANWTCLNRYRESTEGGWLLDSHSSSGLFPRMFGVGVGALGTAYFDETTLTSPLGLTHKAEAGANEVTPLAWLLSHTKDTNPVIADDVDWPDIAESIETTPITRLAGVSVLPDGQGITRNGGSFPLTFKNDSGHLKVLHGTVEVQDLSAVGRTVFAYGGQQHKVVITEIDDTITLQIESPAKCGAFTGA